MLKSMTAFASAESSMTQMSARVEFRTYNSRHLDLNLRVTPGYLPVEEKLKNLIAAHVARGRVEVKASIMDESEAALAFTVDAPKARAYFQALTELRDVLGTADAIPLDLIVSKGDVIRPAEQVKDMDRAWRTLEPCVLNALKDLDHMRQREGVYIAGDFEKRLDRIEQHLEKISKSSQGLLEQYQKRLKERIVQLSKDMVKVDEGRIEQEAALLADKSDISEEIVRAGSHIEQFNAIMKGDAPAGQRLNFLLQEMNREFNTIGSKTGSANVAHLVVEVKSELEKLREQVQNVE